MNRAFDMQIAGQLTTPLVFPVRLNLSAKFATHSAVFFSHNKSVNSTFRHDLSAKLVNLFSFSNS
jgi:hypothetical protein